MGSKCKLTENNMAITLYSYDIIGVVKSKTVETYVCDQ